MNADWLKIKSIMHVPHVPLLFILILLFPTRSSSQTQTFMPDRPPGLFDSTPPTLLSLMITPTLIDVRQQSQMFETSVHVTDDFSGVAKVTIKVSGRMGSDQTTLMRAASFETGSRHDGYWKLKKNISPLAANGTWRVSEVSLTDLQGNVKTYNSQEIAQISTAYVEVYSGLCFTSPWLCADSSDPSSVAFLDGYWALDASTPKYMSGVKYQYSEKGWINSTRQVQTLQELVQQDNEQDLKRNWLYEFYRRRWNATNQMFNLKEKMLVE